MADRLFRIFVSAIPLAGLLLLISCAQSEPFSLAFPVDCRLGQDCIIQNYVDLDPGPGWQDYNCGSLTYDGHKGTDIRVRDLAMMNDGVAVLAAADGVVTGTRNTVTDRKPGQSYDEYMKKVSGKDCGNGVMLIHESGHETYYCHMKKGSIVVKTGDRVKAGDLLGSIGMSGNTQFPHLHISVRKDKQVVSPFTGPCSPSQNYLWIDRIDYTGTKLLKSGFVDAPPTLASIELGENTELQAISDALLFWANIVGIKAGDEQQIVITGPGARTVAQKTQVIQKSKVNWLSYIGKKRPKSGWSSGTYYGTYTLRRNSETIIEETISAVVR